MLYFVKIRNDQGEIYPSYQDFWELVDISGFSTCELSEVEKNSGNTYIFTPMNGNVRDTFKDHTCRAIWLNIERPGEQEFDPMGFEVWMCDKAWADRTNSRFFFMASDERIGRNGDHNRRPISLAYINGRRAGKYIEMNLDNTQAFGEEKKDLLAGASALVVLHQDVPVLSPQRFCYAAASRITVFYEEVPDFYPLVPYEDFIPITFDNCVEQLNKYKDTKLGNNLFNKMCVKTNFKKEVERCL